MVASLRPVSFFPETVVLAFAKLDLFCPSKDQVNPVFKSLSADFPGGSVVEDLPSYAGIMGLILECRRIPHAVGAAKPLHHN